MLTGPAISLYAAPSLPPDEIAPATARAPLMREERRASVALLVLFVPTTFFWETYGEQGNTIALWADDYTDRTINLLFWSAGIPTTWFQAFNPFMIFAFTPFVIALWTWQAKRGAEPSTITKMALGCLAVTLANLIMAVAALDAGGAQGRWLWRSGYSVGSTPWEPVTLPAGTARGWRAAPRRR